jgi:DNA-binding NtrC family response regulator
MTDSASILIVDHDRESLDGLLAVTAEAGYRVTGVQSFEEGRQALDASPDVLVTDVRLGAYNGLQLIIRGRALNPRLRAIVVTAHPDMVVRREAEQLHAIYMVKPINPERLLTEGFGLRDARAVRTPPEQPSQSSPPARRGDDGKPGHRWFRSGWCTR